MRIVHVAPFDEGRLFEQLVRRQHLQQVAGGGTDEQHGLVVAGAGVVADEQRREDFVARAVQLLTENLRAYVNDALEKRDVSTLLRRV